MGGPEYKIFLILANLVLLVFIIGIVVFIFQYHKRKVLHEREKSLINEQHLQELLHTRMEIQQHTMQDIGREIHDNVGQRLTLASIYTNQLAYQNQLPGEAERITTIGKIIDESLAELRALSKNLTHPNSDIADLKELIQEECKRVAALNICEVHSTFNEGNHTISNTIKNFILRIIQEFSQNSLKHAGCTAINLDFQYHQQGLKIEMSDNGRGFELKSEPEGNLRGIGLSNMNKRAELIGADFSLESVVGSGTWLHLFIPVSKLNIV